MAHLGEPIATTILTLLQNNMAAKCAKISGEYQDGIPMPVPAASAYHFGERHLIPEYPAIVVDVEESSIDPERFANPWGVYDHRITVDILLRSDSEKAISYQLLRYARAVWEILYGDQDLTLPNAGPATISLRPVRGGRSPLVRDGGALFKAWRWQLDAHRLDDLG